MAESKAPNSITLTSFASMMGQLYISMFLVLIAAGKSEDSWFRIFVMFYLVTMELFWVGVLLWSVWSRNAAKGVTAVQGTEPAGQNVK